MGGISLAQYAQGQRPWNSGLRFFRKASTASAWSRVKKVRLSVAREDSRTRFTSFLSRLLRAILVHLIARVGPEASL